MLDLLLIAGVTEMKPGSNSDKDHPQLSHNGHPVDDALVGAGSLWPLPLLDSFCFLLNSFVVCACFTKVQNDEVAGFSWALLILFGDGGLGGSAFVTDLVGKWRAQMF
jgi:hypothetical protein